MKISLIGAPSEKAVGWLFKNKKVESWADLGCGNGKYLTSLNIHAPEGVAVDAALVSPDLPPGFVFERSEIFEWLENCQRKFELLTVFDVLEHLEKEKAIRLIEIAKKKSEKIFVSTPSGFMRQDAETHPAEKNNPWQWHRSSFDPDEFEQLGFLVLKLKNYHGLHPGNKRYFDKLICLWSADPSLNPVSLARSIRFKNLIYLLNPRHFYRLIKSFLKFSLSCFLSRQTS